MEKITLVPNYLEADTKEQLIVKMFNKNTENSQFHRYFDIQKDGKKYVAWYFVDLRDEVLKNG